MKWCFAKHSRPFKDWYDIVTVVLEEFKCRLKTPETVVIRGESLVATQRACDVRGTVHLRVVQGILNNNSSVTDYFPFFASSQHLPPHTPFTAHFSPVARVLHVSISLIKPNVKGVRYTDFCFVGYIYLVDGRAVVYSATAFPLPLPTFIPRVLLRSVVFFFFTGGAEALVTI